MNYIRRLAGIALGSLLAFGCFNPDDYDTPPSSTDKISFISADVYDKVADGVDAAEVKVRISDKASPGRRTVIFKTSSGFFVGGKGDSIAVPAMEDFTAAAQLKSLIATTAEVTAKILTVEAPDSRKVTFKRAYPSEIVVTVDSFAVTSPYVNKTTLTASLRTENGGKPSIGHPVEFSVRQPESTSPSSTTIGDFLNNNSTAKTDANGQAIIRYTPGANAQKGYATVVASTTIATPNNSTATTGITTSTTTRIYIK
ncbi:hypothetical protein [Spirosoma flavum]|uniref:Big-1 domain-containing protein n=1 Tax=Spirosoma flavum TaxID=2048557 RepID=A0ABW6AQP0_9BACT